MAGQISPLEHVRDLISGIVTGPLPGLTSDMPLEGLPGWDSIAMVRLVVLLEDELGRQLDDSVLESIETVGDIEKLVKGA